jgi:neutral ceramidase
MSLPNARLSRRGFLVASAALAAAPVSLRAAQQTLQLRAGAAISDITLPLGALNGGVISRGGPAVHVHDDLHARCLALDDGQTQVAIAVCDLRMIGRDVIDRAKRLVHAATRLSADQILISATHTHAAPGAIGLGDAEIDRWYLEFLSVRIADGIRRALGNLAPARIGWGASDQPEHVFNRRWRMRPGTIPPNPFGETTDRVQMNPPRNSPNLVEPAGPVDPQLSIVALQHADGRLLALLANYGLHYIGGYRGGHVSADYFAVFSERMKELLAAEGQDPPFVAMMSNGTSGDVNNIDFRKEEQASPPWTRMREVAHDLADEALAVYRRLRYHDRPAIAVRTAELELGVRRPSTERLAWAREVVAGIKEPQRLTRPQIYASEALELAKFPPRVPVKLQAIRIGELGIAAIPCEVFAETGLAIKTESPLRPTFTIELANGYNGYLPTPQQHELGGYETWPARSAYLEPQAEPQIRATILDLLRQVASR